MLKIARERSLLAFLSAFPGDGKFVQAHTGKFSVFVMAYVSLKKYSVEVYVERKAFAST